MINLGYLIACSAVFLGVCLFFYFATRKKYYHKPAEPIADYENLRNKVTLREKPKKVEEEEEYSGGGGVLSNIIGGFVVILIGFSLIKPISQQVNSAINQTGMQNVSTLGTVTLQLVPGFFAIALLVTGIAIAFRGMSQRGLF